VNEYVALAVEVVAIGVASAAVYFAVAGVRDQLRLQTFAEYTRRYGDIFGSLSSVARDPGSDFALADLDEADRDRHLNIARSYFNLCSEEYYLHKRRRIDRDTWAIWCQGMTEVMRLRWLRAAWISLGSEYSYVPEFAEFFEARMRAAGAS
jgi:hypothetical protein